MSKKLTKEQIQNIIKEHSYLSSKEIGKKYNLHEASVRRILRKKNLYKYKVKKITSEIKDLLVKEYLAGESAEKIGIKYKIDPGVVKRAVIKAGFKLRTLSEAKRVFKINDSFFNTIDSEEKAYFLGLMYADGHVSKNGRGWNIILHNKDKDVLEKLSLLIYGFIKLDSVFIKNIEYVNFRVASVKMNKDLVNAGCGSKKTFNIVFPKLNNILMPHFIRGFLDGDGCICNANPSKTVVDITSNENFLNGLNEFLKENLNISFNKINHKNKTKSKNMQMCSYDTVEIFLDYLYKNATVFMKRKNNSYLIFKERNSARKDKKMQNILNYNTTFIPSYNDILLTKENIEQLTEEQKELACKELVKFYRKNGFPYPTLTADELIRNFNNLKNTDPNKIENNGVFNIANNVGSNIIKHFAPHFFEITDKKNSPSMLAAFNNDTLLYKTIKNRLQQNYTLSSNMLRRGLENSNSAFKGSSFNVLVAKYIYSKYTKEGSLVYDYSMGYGQRLLASLSLDHNIKYIATDPFEKTYKSNIELYNFYKQNIPAFNKSVDLNNQGSEHFFKQEYENKIDLAFSSPPYFNLEKYCEDISQAYSGTYQQFLHNYWSKTVDNIDKMLKPSGLFFLNIKEKVDGFNIADDMIAFFKLKNYSLEKTYNIQLTKNLKFNNKSGVHKYEPIFVLKKN